MSARRTAAAVALAVTVAACGQPDRRRSGVAHGSTPAAEGDAPPPPSNAADSTGNAPEKRDAGQGDDQQQAIDRLLAFENDTRRRTDFAALPPASSITGSNPSDLSVVPGTPNRYVATLAGARSVVLLDDSAGELARVAMPARPSAVSVGTDGVALVVGGRATLTRVRIGDDGLEIAGDARVAGAVALWDVEVGPEGGVYVADEFTGAVSFRGARAGAEWREFGRCHGPRNLTRTRRTLLVNCLLDHQVRAWRVGGDGEPRGPGRVLLEHDGPLWGLAATEVGDRLRIAATGVEDAPLDRSDGGFAFIDSYLFSYEAPLHAGKARRVAALNTSEHGVVMPKAVAFLPADSAAASADLRVATYGFASDRGLVTSWAQPTAPTQLASLPGVTAIAGVAPSGARLAASELLDGWVRLPEAELVAATGGRDPRSVESHIGEALFFTTLMAPWSPADGRRSRFTCETCHFRGYGDGRVHYTGRGDVHASTKALLGLFNNRPHFSRALDKTMAQMVHAEFRVANKHNGRSPWFALERKDFPWLAHVDGAPATMTPEFLRRSFMRWLMDFTYSRNPATAGRSAFSDIERAGAATFRSNCAVCHSSRLVADRPDSTVPFERWEDLIFSDSGAILWARSDYRQVGVAPAVHEKGARVPSLRRLYTKYPYFTNGSARTIDDVLDRVRFGKAGTVWHADGPADARSLTSEQRASLKAFLRLL